MWDRDGRGKGIAVNWRRMMLAGALVGGSIWCLGLVQQVHSEPVDPDPDHPGMRVPVVESAAVVEAVKPVSHHPGMPGPIARPG